MSPGSTIKQTNKSEGVEGLGLPHHYFYVRQIQFLRSDMDAGFLNKTAI